MCVDGEPSSANCLHPMAEADSSISEHAIKVRKPYIITKQRERWTAEEHNKFLEALKLHGRAWRRIEEHIGSKTTVQIRSHAQKFFSKVTRESSSNSPCTVKAIEIPPPRPKRKPNHPYPRKLGHLSIMKGPLIDAQLWPSIANQSVSEQESKSPTSVLSAFGSDTSGTTAADTLKPCMSPVSSVDKTVSVEEILAEQITSAEYKCNKSSDTSPSLTLQDISPMELDLGIQDCFAAKEAPVTGQNITCLRLFGRTVVVAGLQQKPSSKAHCLSSNENIETTVEPNMVSFPSLWNLYGVMPFHSSGALNPSDQSPMPSKDDRFLHNESSQTDSSTTSDSNSEAAEIDVQIKEFPPALVLKPSKNSAFSSLVPSSANSNRGFVPYKRCVVEKERPRTPVANIEGSSYWAKLGCQ
ncbi:hypothetical protein KFK09_001558 [Dendrobium nobile]|uniref:Uncharacterized protein n=1 Tax=Dendrobium nobile TaxID=94219 RepID=A0A8T3C5G6_DENNO|nr:hypothetical protein KFK09_001558 [Dendrobium nobile]